MIFCFDSSVNLILLTNMVPRKVFQQCYCFSYNNKKLSYRWKTLFWNEIFCWEDLLLIRNQDKYMNGRTVSYSIWSSFWAVLANLKTICCRDNNFNCQQKVICQFLSWSLYLQLILPKAISFVMFPLDVSYVLTTKNDKY